MYRERKRQKDLSSVIFLVDFYCKGLRGGGGVGKILEPEERTAALINLTANMLYLENNAQTQFSEVRLLDFSTPFRDAILISLFKIKAYIFVVLGHPM